MRYFRSKLLALAVILIVSGGIFSLSPARSAVASQNAPTSVGVYRWDAWHGGTDAIYQAAKATLQPSQYRTKVPFYGVTNSDGSVDVDDTSPSVMSREISYAKNGGVDYWIFLHYSDYDSSESVMNQSLHTYLANPGKANVKFAYLLSHELYDSLSNYWAQSLADLINAMKDPQYETVLGGRPIVYVYSDAAGSNLANRLAQVRSSAQSAGLPNPYIVTIDLSPANYGGDARTAWTPSGGSGDSWSSYQASVASGNSNLAASGDKAVLTAHVNWDSRPYHDHPPFWWSNPPYTWYQAPTSEQYRQLVQSAVDQTQANPAQNEANTLFVYAWNEFAEGGIMLPTQNSDGTLNTSVLDGLAQVNKSGSTAGSSNNLALGRANYSASSSWDPSQAAISAFDGNAASDWQAASSSTFSDQWVQVDFGTSVTSNGATLSEYGNRTSGYQIQAWNGTSWTTVVTGFAIGSSATVTFPPVTTTKMRLKFTSGSATPIIYEFAVTGPPQNLASGRSTYSSSSNWDVSQGADKAFDGNSTTDWQAASGSSFAGQWLQADLGFPQSVHQASISEYGNRTAGFQVQALVNSQWTPVASGTSIGTSLIVSFPPTYAENWRLLFTQGTYTPVIYELALQ